MLVGIAASVSWLFEKQSLIESRDVSGMERRLVGLLVLMDAIAGQVTRR